ncbi:MAG TPA: hypothetical protein VG013_34305 [Gemmataceae bacterium]|jgi:hypothetical protein|nr:hypothetical protein [Gemmataceae bacterium]
MPSGTPQSQVEWVSLSCPLCKVELRIKAAHAHLRGRCPECGARIEAPRPRSGATQAEEADRLPGLLPVDEEWPESARLEEEPSGYGWGAVHAERPAAPPPPPQAGGAYALASGEARAAAPPPVAEPSASPYEVNPAAPPPPPSAPALFGNASEAGLIREDPPPPPARPLWDGIYTFPWRPDNLGVWLYLTVAFALLAVLSTAAAALAASGGIWVLGTLLLIPIILIIGIWAGTYASGCFFAVIEQTVAGNDRVGWPTGSGISDGLGKLIYLVWVCGCCALVAGLSWLPLAGMPPEGDLWWLLALLPWAVLFPAVLFSSLSAGSPWILLEKNTLLGLMKRPRLALVLWLGSLAVLIPSAWLGYTGLAGVSFLAAAACGPLGAACFLIYGRLLGRAGWVLTHGPARKRSPVKKRRQARAVNRAGR